LHQVAVDTNVLISLGFFRHEAQRAKGVALLDRAAAGELTILIPQFIVFEAIHAFRSEYGLRPIEIRVVLREIMALPGVTVVDHCNWPQFFEHWSDLRPDVGDAAILAVAIANRYSLATFDRKLANRAKTFGVAPYW
jgi:predicted nucleic acid-binding protein